MMFIICAALQPIQEYERIDFNQILYVGISQDFSQFFQ